jgi:cytochrome c-type biogenesis protein CcmH
MRFLLLLITTILMFAAPLHMVLAQSTLPDAPYANQQLEDPVLENTATDLMETLRCITCQSQSIADSDASLAGDMRHQVRTRIAAGEEPEAIRDWMIARYGDWVSYEPSVKPITWPLWAFPLAIILLAAFLLRGRFVRKIED